jgi:hypothetical protein
MTRPHPPSPSQKAGDEREPTPHGGSGPSPSGPMGSTFCGMPFGVPTGCAADTHPGGDREPSSALEEFHLPVQGRYPPPGRWTYSCSMRFRSSTSSLRVVSSPMAFSILRTA